MSFNKGRNNMKFKSEIMKIDKKSNINHRIYTQESIENILNTWKEHNYIIYNPSQELDEDLKYICGKITNLYLDDDSLLIAEGELFENPIASGIKQLMNIGKNMYLSISGFGIINSFDEIEDYEFNHFIIVDESSFNVKPMGEIK